MSPRHSRTQYRENVRLLREGTMEVRRESIMPRLLTVSDVQAIIRRPFKPPFSGRVSRYEQQLQKVKTLGARRRFHTGGFGGSGPSRMAENADNGPAEGTYEPLVLWQPDEDDIEAARQQAEEEGKPFRPPQPIAVEGVLAKWLRPHQREGVQFMFECVAGLREFEGNGCILADDMGLGKTLQSITLLYTLLRQGFKAGTPMVRKAIIVCPTSLVGNWENELSKWLGNRIRCVALCEAVRDDVIRGIDRYLRPGGPDSVLIVSYETFRLHAQRFANPRACDLLICDEAHRLKNDKTLTNQALNKLPTRRRVLLSGTPLQNDLEEFYAMVDFTNPGMLGSASRFRKRFQTPILLGREPDADSEEREEGEERTQELSEMVNMFILRRTNALLSAHLPPKLTLLVCCRLSQMQRQLYEHFLNSAAAQNLVSGKSKGVLSSITALRKLINHPKLIYDSIRTSGNEAAGFEDCEQFFPDDFGGRGRDRNAARADFSGKMLCLANLLHSVRTTTSDRVVLVSNFTQTLDIFAALCRTYNYPFVRLDGGTTVGKRTKLVDRLNDPEENVFCFLLSSKAGGCGLNMIGANRLVLFDPDWNPATDLQAAARVWRDGQKKKVFVYRFFAAGTIEEKVFQRQLSKEGLKSVISETGENKQASVSTEDLRDLFTLRDESCPSDTYEAMVGDKGKPPGFERTQQVGSPEEGDLALWAHHDSVETVEDPCLHNAAEQVSFTFTLDTVGQAIKS